VIPISHTLLFTFARNIFQLRKIEASKSSFGKGSDDSFSTFKLLLFDVVTLIRPVCLTSVDMPTIINNFRLIERERETERGEEVSVIKKMVLIVGLLFRQLQMLACLTEGILVNKER